MENNKEKSVKTEKMFACMPELVRYFQGLERKIRYYNRYIWEEGVTKEKLLKKYEALTALVKEVDGVDLQILFYLRSLKGGGRFSMLKVLKERYQAECNYYNELYQTQEKFDICVLGEEGVLKMLCARNKKH